MNGKYYLLRDRRNQKQYLIDILINEITIIWIIYLVANLIPILSR